MLTAKQKNWIDHLSNNPGEIKIFPFDPSAQEKFEKARSLILSKIDHPLKVEHHGASSLGISGQDEIDVYVPVPEVDFDKTVLEMAELFGKPRSHYPLRRARFRTEESGKKIEIFVINEELAEWTDSLKFENYLKSHPKELLAYERLKEAGDGLSTREYYRRKIKFINKMLNKA